MTPSRVFPTRSPRLPRRALSARPRRHRRAARHSAGARRRGLHRRQPARRRAGGRALHLRRLQLVPAGRPLALDAEGRPVGRRPRLPRRLLGSPRLEGPLRQRRLHGAPGGAAGEQRRALQLHAAGRRRRPRPHRLVAGAARSPARGQRRRSTSRWRTEAIASSPPSTPAAGAPQRLAAYWAVTEQGHVTAVKAGENEGVTLHHDFVVRDYEPVAAWSARARRAETLTFEPATRGRRRASAQRQPGRRRRRERAAGAGRQDRLLSRRTARRQPRQPPRSAARSSAPISGSRRERIGRIARLHDVLEPRLHARRAPSGGCRCRSGRASIASKTKPATSAALTLPRPTARSLIALPISWLRGRRVGGERVGPVALALGDAGRHEERAQHRRADLVGDEPQVLVERLAHRHDGVLAGVVDAHVRRVDRGRPSTRC